MSEPFVGGFAYPGAHSGPSTPPPPIPPKDDYVRRFQGSNGYKGSHLSQTESISSTGTGNPNDSSMTYTTQHMAKLSAVERSRNFKVARMNPHLQFMAGPLLRYDTVDEQGVWHGAALIVCKCIYSTRLRAPVSTIAHYSSHSCGRWVYIRTAPYVNLYMGPQCPYPAYA